MGSPPEGFQSIGEDERGARGENDTVLTGYKLVAVTVGLCCCVFCTALDNTIVATAVPRIVSQFHSLNDIGWYGSAYLLTTCVVTLVFGRVYTFFPVKWVYLGALLVFELGSLICGAAPSSVVLIIGRAIAGLGGGGLLSGSLVIIAQSVPQKRRPAFSGFVMGMFAVASVTAPLLGGAFADHLTWRWCFYINLPLGAITAIAIFFAFQPTKPIVQTTRHEKVWGLDPLGNLCFLPSIICLLLALQWGGSVYVWQDGRIIGLFVVFGVLFILFFAIQLYMRDKATLPPRILCRRNIWGSALFSFCLNSAMFIFVYYLPIWFQAVKGVSATTSGLMNLPLILSNVLFIMASGLVVTLIGPRCCGALMLLSTAMISISSGLLTTLQTNAPPAKWAGYQVFLGIGLGIGAQLPMYVVQTTLSTQEIPTATALMTFTPLLGSSVFVAVAQNLFQRVLVARLTEDLPGLDVGAVLGAGPTGLHELYEGDTLQRLLHVYSTAIVRTFYVAVGLAIASIVGSTAVVLWRPRKSRPEHDEDDEAILLE